MLTEQVFTVRGVVYLAKYSHKHGDDFSIHTTFEGAQAWFLSIVSDFMSESCLAVDEDDYWHGKSPEEMFQHWDDVTGGSEYFDIIELELQK